MSAVCEFGFYPIGYRTTVTSVAHEDALVRESLSRLTGVDDFFRPGQDLLHGLEDHGLRLDSVAGYVVTEPVQ